MKETVAWFGARGRSLQIMISVATASAFLLFGYDRTFYMSSMLIIRGSSGRIDLWTSIC